MVSIDIRIFFLLFLIFCTEKNIHHCWNNEGNVCTVCQDCNSLLQYFLVFSTSYAFTNLSSLQRNSHTWLQWYSYYLFPQPSPVPFPDTRPTSPCPHPVIPTSPCLYLFLAPPIVLLLADTSLMPLPQVTFFHSPLPPLSVHLLPLPLQYLHTTSTLTPHCIFHSSRYLLPRLPTHPP